MTDDLFRTKLNEALAKINELPADRRGSLMCVIEQIKQRHKEMNQSFEKLSDLWDESRLLMKYLLFDREASRREAEELRLGEQGA